MLADFTERALEYLDANSRAMLFITMGGRKTTTVIEHAIRKGYKKVLVVCLKDNIATWSDEFDKWYPNETYTPVMGSLKNKLDRTMAETKFILAGYDSLKRHPKGRELYDAFKTMAPSVDLVIFDESYTISNHQSKRFKDIRRIISPIPNRIIMDGEPTAEGIQKLYGQFLMCDGGQTFGRDWYSFMERYFYDPGLSFPMWKERKGSWQKVSKILATRGFVFTEKNLRESKVGLPSQVNYLITPTLNKMQRDLSARIKKEWVLQLSEEKEHDIKYTMEQLSKLRQVLDGFVYHEDGTIRVASVKEDVLRKLLQHKLAHKKKIVIWGAFRESLNIIDEVCRSVGRKALQYHGGLSITERASVLYEFTNDDEVEVCILQASCGVGLNALVVSNVSIYYSNTDRRRDRAQSEKRVTRPTQDSLTTYVIDIVTKGTMDEKIYTRLQSKSKKSHRLLSYRDMRKELSNV